MSERIHIVERGETLSSISQRYYGREDHADVILRANKLASPTIFIGEELTIPEIDISPICDNTRGQDYDPLARRPEASASRQIQKPTSKTGWIIGGLLVAILIFLGFAIKVPVDNSDYMDRALASCRKQYTSEVDVNDCAIRLGAEKLLQIQRDKMDAARNGVR